MLSKERRAPFCGEVRAVCVGECVSGDGRFTPQLILGERLCDCLGEECITFDWSQPDLILGDDRLTSLIVNID